MAWGWRGEKTTRESMFKGKIVILTEETLGYSKFWLGTFADRAARAGAVGIIFIHPMPWPYRMSMEAGNSNLGKRFCEKKLPAVCISAVGGLKLTRGFSGGHCKVRMETKTADGGEGVGHSFRHFSTGENSPRKRSVFWRIETMRSLPVQTTTGPGQEFCWKSPAYSARRSPEDRSNSSRPRPRRMRLQGHGLTVRFIRRSW